MPCRYTKTPQSRGFVNTHHQKVCEWLWTGWSQWRVCDSLWEIWEWWSKVSARDQTLILCIDSNRPGLVVIYQEAISHAFGLHFNSNSKLRRNLRPLLIYNCYKFQKIAFSDSHWDFDHLLTWFAYSFNMMPSWKSAGGLSTLDCTLDKGRWLFHLSSLYKAASISSMKGT